MILKNEKYNISKVFNNNYDLCCNCGMCVGICPTNAIKLNEEKGILVPCLNLDKCVNCIKCVKYCPIIGSESQENDENPHSKTQKFDINVGFFEKIYVGYSASQEIRFNSSSGGISTEILLYLIDNKIVDGLILTKFDLDMMRPVPFIARNRDEILEASGSKYCIVALNKIFKDIENFDGKLAIVGLPCHFRALKKLEKEDEKIRQKIILHIGLMCSGTIGFYGIEVLLDCLGINKLKSFSFRGNGWPGGLYVEDVKSRKYYIPYEKYFSLLRFFLPKFCLVCNDWFNELADISLGDAWLPFIKERKSNGINLIIGRNIKGENILRKMKENGKIIIDEIELKTIQSGSQYKDAIYKKSNLEIKRSICLLFQKNNVFHGNHMSSIKFPNLLRFLFLYMRYIIMKTKLSILIFFIIKQILKSEVKTNV